MRREAAGPGIGLWQAGGTYVRADGSTSLSTTEIYSKHQGWLMVVVL